MAESGSLPDVMRGLLAKRQANSTLRKLTVTPPTSIDFSSNDFLSLSTSPSLREVYLHQLTESEDFRLGSRGSRLLDGNSAYAEQLEKDIASFHHAPAGLLFNSGFDANSGFFACVPQPGDIVLYDEYIHASVHEGMRLSRAGACISFAHNSLDDLEYKLEAQFQNDDLVCAGSRNVFVAIESLYSMDGDLSPIKDIVELVERLLPKGNGHIVVDEAHSTGIYGLEGRGIVCSLGLEDRIFARLHTFGKALACNGAIFLCSSLTREYLINYARPLIYTTFMSFPSLAAIQTVTSFMRRGGTVAPAAHLWMLVKHLYRRLDALTPGKAGQGSDGNLFQIPSRCPESPIFSILTPKPRSLSKAFQDAGFMVRAIVPPTVPDGGERVRVCLHAGNSFDEVDRLVSTLGMWVNQMRDLEGRGRMEDGLHKPRMLKL